MRQWCHSASLLSSGNGCQSTGDWGTHSRALPHLAPQVPVIENIFTPHSGMGLACGPCKVAAANRRCTRNRSSMRPLPMPVTHPSSRCDVRLAGGSRGANTAERWATPRQSRMSREASPRPSTAGSTPRRVNNALTARREASRNMQHAASLSATLEMPHATAPPVANAPSPIQAMRLRRTFLYLGLS